MTTSGGAVLVLAQAWPLRINGVAMRARLRESLSGWGK